MNPTKFLAHRSEIGELIFERTEEITGLILALLSRKNVVFLGPVGSTKSLMVRLNAHAVTDGAYYETLLTKFSTPEQLFGPPDIIALQQGVWAINTKGRLPEAVHAFIDEVFRGNASVQDTLLRVMNERLFDMSGTPQKIPLELFVGAANSVPSDEDRAAFYDRFTLKYKTNYIAEQAHFVAMLKGPKRFEEFAARLKTTFSLDEIHEAQAEAQAVVVPDAVLEGIAMIRSTLAQQAIVPSDRKWNESIEVIRAKAWLQGRSEAMMDDLSVLTHILWTDPQHKSVVQGIVLEVANPLLKKAEEQHDAIQSAWANLQKFLGDRTKSEKEKTMQSVECLSKVNTAIKDLGKTKAEGERNKMDMSLVDDYIRAGTEIQRKVQKDYLLLPVS